MTEAGDQRLLNSFLDYLGEQLEWEFDRDNFDDRFLLQKYVFFAQRLGLQTEYGYNVYAFGAYSPELARDYYSSDLNQSGAATDISEQLDSESFDELVRSREPRWLELASTFLLYYEIYSFLEEDDRRQKAIEKTMDEKEATEHTLNSIERRLRDIGVIPA